MLMLQFGGVQVAITEPPPPAEVVVTEKLLLWPRPQLPAPGLTDAKAEEHHVKKSPVITLFWVSVTIAVTAVLVPRVTPPTLFPCPSSGESVMDCTRQVVKLNGELETPSTVAKMGLTPGTAAVATACPGNSPFTGFLAFAATRVTTVLLTACQEKGPTLAVISSPGAGPPWRL